MMHQPSRTILTALAAAGIALSGACSPRDGAGPPASARAAALPDEPPAIRGLITAIADGRARIEERPEEQWGSAKAVVRLDGTHVVHRSGSAATVGDLAVGQRVSAWFRGPVAESYPVQATADVVVIEPDAR
jgi:hypothetical protein